MIACSPGKQPLWRYLEATNSHSMGESNLKHCRLTSFADAGSAVDAFITREADAIGVIGATYLRLQKQSEIEISMFQPVTWMAQGPVLCAQGILNEGGVLALKKQTVACWPLASDLMAYWQALIFQNYGYRLEELFDLRPVSTPRELLENRRVRAAFVTAESMIKLGNEGFHKVTDVRTEWDRAVGEGRMPVMGGLVSRSKWADENRPLLNELAARLLDGLRLYRTDKDMFLGNILQWKGISPSLIMEKAEASFWCSYWGMDLLDEDRLQLSAQDWKDIAALEGFMYSAGCLT